MFRSRRILRNQTLIIDELRRTNQLLKSIPEQMANAPGTINIQNLKIEQATLDKLLFQLERIDVKELSGTLNLGNNFQLDNPEKRVLSNKIPKLQGLIQSGAEHSDAAKVDSDAPSDACPQADRPNVTTTNSGYMVKVTRD
ncbi:hypothetical protein NZD89_23620 [Alicyclobacillus fastidiosus]|uniref:Uncharacterized protein n=1 Tax=Alicyclobacillus fastidiosus TaxID=392011 RepID=A0ABY6ZEF1_9BACL|nr:hypothetical protein [Alicyclobacillus fastidiosus]WAH41217.1 hypothetical protein NZD89_23620 [Alicyclobacillus fastidiosus]GMA62801.1 hypothetical protein GCM10025859_32410 [Alicyclobacillus fastidiosus]